MILVDLLFFILCVLMENTFTVDEIDNNILLHNRSKITNVIFSCAITNLRRKLIIMTDKTETGVRHKKIIQAWVESQLSVESDGKQ